MAARGARHWIELVQADVADAMLARRRPRLRRADVVFHLAAAGVDQADQDSAASCGQTCIGTLAMLQLAQRLGARRSSTAAPASSTARACARRGCRSASATEYGASKAAAGSSRKRSAAAHGLPVGDAAAVHHLRADGAPRRLVPPRSAAPSPACPWRLTAVIRRATSSSSDDAPKRSCRGQRA